MNRHINTFAIPNSLKSKLLNNGLETENDVRSKPITDLMKNGFSRAEISEIYETIDMYSSMKKPATAYDLLKKLESEKTSHIPTLSTELDRVLGGGIYLSKLTEICGSAGMGKTQLCMQLCVNVQIPEQFGGLGGHAVYIDTEGSLVPSRLTEIANATINRIQKTHHTETSDDANGFNVKKVLSNIICFRCTDHIQLIATVNRLGDLIDKNPKIKLVVVDSLAYPFRFVEFKDSNAVTMKMNVLNNFMENAYKLMSKHNLAMVVTNQMTTKIVRDTNSSHLAPALGETWAHSANIRLVLASKGDKRVLAVTKSSFLPDSSVVYRITKAGLEDALDEDQILSDKTTMSQNLKKRRLEHLLE